MAHEQRLSARARAILEAAERAVTGGAAPPPTAPTSGAPTPAAPPPAAPAPAAGPAPTPAAPTPPPRPDRPSPAPPVPAPTALSATVDAVRELARQLAEAGATRREVDARLRADHGLRETYPLLDELYGVGSAPDARLAAHPAPVGPPTGERRAP